MAINPQALTELEQLALKHYANGAAVPNAIAQAWLQAVADDLERYHIAIYSMSPEDKTERRRLEEQPGASNIIPFMRRGANLKWPLS
jgi:hypothetical protein